MGFVSIEDVQGNIELVLFPRTWAQYREQMTVGQIVIVEGKADTNSNPPKILVDTVRTEIKILEPLDSVTLSKPVVDPVFDMDFEPSPNGGKVTDVNYKSTQPGSITSQEKPAPVKPAPQVKPALPPPPRQSAEKPAKTYTANPPADITWDDSDVPPPPDNFPEDWENQWQPSFEEAAIAARPEPKVDSKPVSTPRPQLVESAPAQTVNDERKQPEASHEAVAFQTMKVEPPLQIPASLYVSLAKEENDKDHPPQQVTVILRSTGDKDHDRRRIKTIFGTLISFHGRDRFSFQIFENGSGYLIDFPNDTTRVCTEMLQRLKKLMGEESWRVEEITFQ